MSIARAMSVCLMPGLASTSSSTVNCAGVIAGVPMPPEKRANARSCARRSVYPKNSRRRPKSTLSSIVSSAR